MAKRVSLRAFATMRKVSPEAVSKAIKTGRISATKGKNGRMHIDPVAAGREWDARTDQAKQRKELREDERAGPTAGINRVANLYSTARAVREEYQGRIARLEYEERAGKLVSAQKVGLEAFQAARLTRDSILNLPNKIAHELAAETDPAKIHIKLTAALTEALEELALAGKRRAEEPEAKDKEDPDAGES